MDGARMSTVAQRLNGAAPLGVRQRDDFYPTPPEGTEALLSVERFEGAIWEPACGNGAICKVLNAAGYETVGTDLVDRGFGLTPVDFLFEQAARAPNIVTNPPFKLGVEFVRHALRLAPAKVAMLVQLRFLEGLERKRLFAERRPARVWVFSRRLPMPSGDEGGSAGGMLAFAWFVWDADRSAETKLGWL